MQMKLCSSPPQIISQIITKCKLPRFSKKKLLKICVLKQYGMSVVLSKSYEQIKEESHKQKKK